MSKRSKWRRLFRRLGRPNVDPKVETLSRSHAFNGLSRAELEYAARQFDEVAVAAGTVLIREGARNQTLWLIVEGHVEVTLRGRTVREHSHGELIGVPTLISGGVAGVTARAYSNLNALVASERQFWSLMTNAQIESALREIVAFRVRRDFFSLLWMTREHQFDAG
jgi:CRP-like cAMP-binding protein